MMSRPCRKFRRLDAPVLSPISRVDENNGYGDDADSDYDAYSSLLEAIEAAMVCCRPPMAWRRRRTLSRSTARSRAAARLGRSAVRTYFFSKETSYSYSRW